LTIPSHSLAAKDLLLDHSPRWGRFTDIKDIKKEMLKRLEAHFEKWLHP
jgi:hypothetical protein